MIYIYIYIYMQADVQTCQHTTRGTCGYEWPMYAHEGMDVRAYVHAGPVTSTFTRTRARTCKNQVDPSRLYFCTSDVWNACVVFGSFRRTEIRSTLVDVISVHACARAGELASEPAARMCAHTSAHWYAHVRPLARSQVLCPRSYLSRGFKKTMPSSRQRKGIRVSKGRAKKTQPALV